MKQKLFFGLILAITSIQVIPIRSLLAQEKSDSSKNTSNANQNNPIMQQGIVHQKDTGKANEKAQVKDDPPLKNSIDYTKWGFWLNFGLTGITFLIAAASLMQANAARISANAVMLSERAWMFPDGEKDRPANTDSFRFLNESPKISSHLQHSSTDWAILRQPRLIGNLN